jgi:hypothetical protein
MAEYLLKCFLRTSRLEPLARECVTIMPISA